MRVLSLQGDIEVGIAGERGTLAIDSDSDLEKEAC
jgi:hypothetical protein